jgi:hypothetical protein
LPGALIIRWLAWIRLFDFDIRHILEIKHTAANGFSRRFRTKSDNDDEENKINIDNFIDAELVFISVRPIKARVIFELNDSYSLRS